MRIIKLRNISKTFIDRSWRTVLFPEKRKKVEALKGVSLEIQAGEIFGLLGPNGAGKTTLIKILATLITPDSGSGTICGYDIFRQAHDVRRVIGLVNTSERSFYWRLTGRQNLEFFATLNSLTRQSRKKRIEELLNLVRLEDMADTPFMKYSTGQKQRLAISRALLAAPRVLLMDEPTSSLDPLGALEIRKFTKEELVGEYGKTVLWCTHNLKEAEEMCSRLSIIHKGRVVASGDLEYLKSLIPSENSYKMKVSSASLELFKKVGILPHSVSRNDGNIEFEIKAEEENIPSILKRLIENNVKVYTCNQKEMKLEEVFEKLIQNDN
ncbi:MAG: ABC transporter ATP-binding protein [Nitrospirota bacterium]